MNKFYDDANVTDIKDMITNKFFDQFNLIIDKRIEVSSYLVYRHVEVDGYSKSYFVNFTGKLIEFSNKEEAIAFAAARLGDAILNKDGNLIRFLFKDLCKKESCNGGYEKWICIDPSISKAVAGNRDLLIEIIFNELRNEAKADADMIISRMNFIKSIVD